MSKLLVTVCIAAFVASAIADAVSLQVIEVDLDLPAGNRWNNAIAAFPGGGELIAEYFRNTTKVLPKVVLDLLAWIVEAIDEVGGISADALAEIEGLATGLDLPLKTLLTLNILYELRRLAPPANTTGPLPSSLKESGSPFGCTSIIAEDPEGNLWHGRNLDWNLPNSMKMQFFQCNVTRSGVLQYYGGCALGFIGMLSVMMPNGWSVTIDERSDGGSLITDSLIALIEGGVDPTHALRQAADSTPATYEDMMYILGNVTLAAPVYYIVGGTQPNEGSVITRDRTDVYSSRSLNDTTWFVLETNYDWNKQPPSYDDRRAYALEYLNALGSENVTSDSLYTIMDTWPVKNNHTAYTVMMQAASGYFSLLAQID